MGKRFTRPPGLPFPPSFLFFLSGRCSSSHLSPLVDFLGGWKQRQNELVRPLFAKSLFFLFSFVLLRLFFCVDLPGTLHPKEKTDSKTKRICQFPLFFPPTHPPDFPPNTSPFSFYGGAPPSIFTHIFTPAPHTDHTANPPVFARIFTDLQKLRSKKPRFCSVPFPPPDSVPQARPPLLFFS